MFLTHIKQNEYRSKGSLPNLRDNKTCKSLQVGIW